MNRKDKMIYDNEKGFALLAAIIAALILLAVGVLAIDLSSADRRASAVVVGDKKAFAAAESGVHRLVQDFDPTATWTEANNYTQNCTSTIPTYIWQTIASGIDDRTRFAFCRPEVSDLPPLSPEGYSLGGGVTYGIMRYDTTVVGQSESYKSMNKVDIGIGFGPVPMSP